MESLKLFLLLQGTVGRARYLVLGVVLFLVKYALDRTVAYGHGRSWSLLNYLIWPDESVLVFQLPEPDRKFALALLVVALPFIWVGVALTAQRLRDASLSLWIVVLFFIPAVNLLLILGLCLLPSRTPMSGAPAAFVRGVVFAHQKVTRESRPAAFLFACVVSAAVTALLVFFSARLLESYGFGVFVAVPFLQGFLAAVLYGLRHRRTINQCLAVSVVSLSLSGAVLLALAAEGAICLFMAAPIAYSLGILGGLVGFSLQCRPGAGERVSFLILGLLVLQPALMAAEKAAAPEPTLREVRTAVIVDAPPSRVFDHVVAFTELPEPTDLLFRSGIAYPQRAQISGHGVGAVRHCIFSTGAFVEPIEIWDEPHRLEFSVTAQPPPMKELSPFEVEPPHLDGFLVSKRGRFLLEELPGGRTRLEGTTWYTNKMWPASYWYLFADFIIHRIHGRVLDHVKGLAERGDVPDED